MARKQDVSHVEATTIKVIVRRRPAQTVVIGSGHFTVVRRSGGERGGHREYWNINDAIVKKRGLHTNC